MKDGAPLIQPEQIEQVILLIRGHRVMLDRDLAALYGVTTGNLNKAVRRNLERFPPDFMFQLTPEEAEALSFHFGSLGRGQHFKYLPRVFTQEGVSMLSGVLRSPRGFIGPTDPRASADWNLREKFRKLRPIDHFQSHFPNVERWNA